MRPYPAVGQRWVCFAGGHLLKHWSVTQKTFTLSSGEAELGGVVKAATEGIGLQSLAQDLGLDFSLQLYADSSAAIGICRRSGIGRVRHLEVGQLWSRRGRVLAISRSSRSLGLPTLLTF